MATSYFDPLLQLFDELGADILSGGKIYTYGAGTTTPLATYQDLEGETANTNPVILDSSGMAEIRFTDGTAYKIEVTDSDNNLLWTRDDITVGLSAADAGNEYLVHASYSGTPGAQAMMTGHIFDGSVTFPIDFEGAQGAVLTAPGSTYTISIRKNDVEVGTAAIDTSGVFTFATTGGTTVSFVAGNRMTFIAPDSGTAADFMLTLPGEVA